MTTSLQRTSLGELGYSPLAATSLGELGGAILIIPGGGLDEGLLPKRRKQRERAIREAEDIQMLLIMVSIIEQDRDT